jgi:hypothetical protein
MKKSMKSEEKKCFVCGESIGSANFVTLEWCGRMYKQHEGCKLQGALGDPNSTNYNVNATRRIVG